MKKYIILVLVALPLFAFAQSQADRDAKVEKFLKEHRDEWHDLNVPFVDGQTLHDLIIKNGYKSALEIGTSTGHSTIWIAWAMSKTGGKGTTLELSEKRQKQAIKNLTEADLIEFGDSKHGNAHEMAKPLPWPFDF